MIVPTDGSHIECPTCRGEKVLQPLKRAMLSFDPSIHTLPTTYRCPACDGTGWLPPKHRKPPEPMDFSKYDVPDDGG
jgi:hypothetical protein